MSTPQKPSQRFLRASEGLGGREFAGSLAQPPGWPGGRLDSDNGHSLPALQRLLGHDHLATTEIYLNLSPEEVIREFREKW